MTRRYSRILVTGGAGFIGSHIVDRLLTDGFEVTALDNLCTGQMENVALHQDREDFHFVKGDIRDLNLVKSIVHDIEAVFHEAALTSMTDSLENPLLTNEVNVTGTLNLLDACLDSNVKRFIFASSAAVYGKKGTLPHHKGLTPQPISSYRVSKLAAENYVKVFHEAYGLETVCLRYFNVYGPRQTYGQYSGAITIFINRLLCNQPPIIYGDGMQTRDFINIQDVAGAMHAALCLAHDYRARLVLDILDHVWREVWNDKERRWVHVDPSEKRIDDPKMYERDWKKNLKEIYAFEYGSIENVTQ